MQKKNSSQSNQLRIIGGTYRSRKLTFPTLPGLRPTGDRVRETLFNWLAPHIVGSTCLDLFAGSGALGIEALSRGASLVIFIDSSPLGCESIRNNLNLLDPGLIKNGKAQVICTDSLHWLAEPSTEMAVPFDIVFLDPPFAENLLEACATKLEYSTRLKADGLIYIERAASELAQTNTTQQALPSHWLSIKNKRAGNVSYQLFCRSTPSTR